MEDHSLISPQPVSVGVARRFYAVLLARPEQELSTAISWIERGTIPLSLEDCAILLRRHAEEQGTTVTEPEVLLESFFAMEGLRSALAWSPAQLIEFLARDAKEANPATDDAGQARVQEILLRFFAADEALEHTKKAQRIYDGLVPSFQGCSSIVDFRPVYNSPRTDIQHGIIAASLTIRTRGSDPSVEDEAMSFQLDASDIKALVNELTQLQQKIGLLRDFTDRQNMPLLNPSKSLTQ